MRNFSAKETEWLFELDGIEHASFWQRALVLMLDWIIVSFLLSLFASLLLAGVFSYMHKDGKSMRELAQAFSASIRDDNLEIGVGGSSKANVYLNEDSVTGETSKILFGILVPILYFGSLL